MNFTILRFEQIDSTNTEAAKQARLGADEGLCIIAREQTKGRGRRGRKWVSEKDSGLYFSVVLKPTLEARFLPLITLMAGIAVHDTLIEFGLEPDIKWVNDILVREKKISGILAETVDTPAGLSVIVGIGINLISASLPGDISAIATSLEAETGKRFAPDEMAGTLTPHLSNFYDLLIDVDGPAEIVRHWRQRSTYSSGKRVRVTTANGSFDGVTDGLEKNGSLRLKTADGSVVAIQAGDVQQLRSGDADEI